MGNKPLKHAKSSLSLSKFTEFLYTPRFFGKQHAGQLAALNSFWRKKFIFRHDNGTEKICRSHYANAAAFMPCNYSIVYCTVVYMYNTRGISFHPS